MIKVSELLKNEIHPLIHGALISRIIVSNDDKYFAAVSSYQKSTKLDEDEFDFDLYTDKYVDTLNELTNTKTWISLDSYNSHFRFCNFSFRGQGKKQYLSLIMT